MIGRMMTPSQTSHLFADRLPLALGTLKLATTGQVSAVDAEAVIHAAIGQGITIFDTADCYFHASDDKRYGEHLLRDALKSWPGNPPDVLLMTKVGLTRRRGKWIPNGRPEHVRESAIQSLQALGVKQIPLLQLHVRDPDVPFEETLAALSELQSEGLVRDLGLCNTTPEEIDIASEYFDVAVVQNELGPWKCGDTERNIIAHTAELGIPLLAYRPLNQCKHNRRLRATKHLVELAKQHHISLPQAAVAWTRSLAPHVIPLFGATQIASVRASRAAVEISLPVPPMTFAEDHLRVSPSAAPADADEIRPLATPDVLIVMGIQGSGKSEFVAPFLQAGYKRLNRDLHGGSLKDLIRPLDRLMAGRARVVLDNTYPTCQSRADVIATAARHRVPVRCLHIKTPLIEAQKNVVLRMLSKYGLPLGPMEMERLRKTDPNLPPPQALARWLQSYEAPTAAEGFSSVVETPFERRADPAATNKGLLLDVDGTIRRTLSGEPFPRHPDDVQLLPNRQQVLQQWLQDGYQLFFVSNQGGIAANMVTHEVVQAAMYKTVEQLGLPITEITYCSHPTRPVGCFCRKPLPGLGVYLMARYGLDPEQCVMVGDMDTDQKFAAGLGIDFAWADDFFT